MDDLWVFWAAYREGSFKQLPAGIEKDAFYKWMLEVLSKYSYVLVIEDDNKAFKGKRGIIAFVAVTSNGWRIEPHVEVFKWATKLNVLRGNVRFFNWIRQNKEVGVCVVKSLKETANLFHHVRKYGVLNFVGKIPGGDPLGRGDEHVFSIRGKKFANAVKE